MKLTLDLHDISNRGDDIDRALQGVMDEAIRKKARLVEIIPGKGSGQLKKRVLRFLDRKDIKPLYHRVEKDSHNFGRAFVHFRPKWGTAGGGPAGGLGSAQPVAPLVGDPHRAHRRPGPLLAGAGQHALDRGGRLRHHRHAPA